MPLSPDSPITVAGQPVVLTLMPTTPGPRMVEPAFGDSVAVVTMPFTGQTQAQGSTGADQWSLKVTLPQLTNAEAPAWLAWLLQMRGMARAVQMAPPPPTLFAGTLTGSAPVVSTAAGSTTENVAAGTTLYTRGWLHSQAELLKPFTAFQLGYRLHWTLDAVSSDAEGNASFEIWPSLREAQADATPLVLTSPLGLFRLADNRRDYSRDITRLSTVSFPLVEYR